MPHDIFHGSPNLQQLFLETNQIRRIDGRLFANNTALTDINLQNNIINAIEFNFIEHLISLRVLNLISNECANQQFTIETGNLEPVLIALQSCFDNFVVKNVRQYRLILEGTLEITEF